MGIYFSNTNKKRQSRLLYIWFTKLQDITLVSESIKVLVINLLVVAVSNDGSFTSL